MEIQRKYQALLDILSTPSGVLVAFSGGVDSTLLLAAAVKANSRVLAVTAASPLRPRAEAKEAGLLAKKLGADHLTLNTDELALAGFDQNPRNRCYLCKRHMCQLLQKLAKEKKLELVVDGSNSDDRHAYRPGIAALEECGASSPLAEAGLTKEEIRLLSKELALPTWDKPSSPCLATRFPYDTPLSPELLAMVESGERALASLGFSQLRLRVHASLARLELPIAEIPRVLEKREIILKALTELGFRDITLDLAGLRSGSFDL